MAYRVTDRFSIGAGVNAQYADARLTSAVDFGATCFSQLDPMACASLGLTPQAADGRAVAEGDDWSYGWNAGILWSPHPDWSIGVNHRSGIDHELDGSARFDAPIQAMPLTMNGAFAETAVTAGLDLPASTELGVKWAATDQLRVYADMIWTDWSSLEALELDYENPAQPNSVEELNYQDAGRYSLGLDYEVFPNWTLRGGYAFDESPVQPNSRSARIPDNDRHVFALGTSWDAFDTWSVDVGYNRIEIEDVEFAQTGRFGDQVIGDYTGSADIVMLGFRKSF